MVLLTLGLSIQLSNSFCAAVAILWCLRISFLGENQFLKTQNSPRYFFQEITFSWIYCCSSFFEEFCCSNYFYRSHSNIRNMYVTYIPLHGRHYDVNLFHPQGFVSEQSLPSLYQCITDRLSLSVRPFVQLLHFFYILLKDLRALFYIELIYFNM